MGKNYFVIFFETISKPILLNILALYNGSLAKHKASILSLVASEFSLKFLIDFGFPITQRQYLYAQQKKKETVTLQPYIQAIPKSKEKLDETIIEKIILVCKDNSFLTSSERLRKSFYPDIIFQIIQLKLITA